MKRDCIGSDLRYGSQWDASVTKSAGEARIQKAAERLREHIAKARGERHDAIVYAAGYEFDQTSSDAVEFIAEKLQHSIGVTAYNYRFKDDDLIDCVIPAVTLSEYEAYLANGGIANEIIENQIRIRDIREQRCLKVCWVTYIPDQTRLSKILDYFYMAQVYADVDIKKSKFDFWGFDFWYKYYKYFWIALIVVVVAFECVLIWSK